jgi:predicted enzyme related to lactoylglutathione lyase
VFAAMNRAFVFSISIVSIGAIDVGCGNGSAPAMAPITAIAGAGSQTTSVTGTPSAGTAGAVVSVIAGASGSASSTTAASAGASAPLVAGSTGSTAGNAGSDAGGAGSPAADGGAGSPAADGGRGGSAGALGGAGSAGAATAGSGSTDIPAPMAAPLVWGFGIGITDVPAAVKFYSGAMQMAVEKDAVKRDDRTETTLYSTQAMRGARVVLMNYDDMRNTRMITTKLVWQAQDAAGVNSAASMYPDYVSRLNIGVVQFDGPETYIQEVGSVFDTGGTGISVPYPVAIGFAVSDQPAARMFYTSLGMMESSIGTFSVTDATGTGTIAEYSEKFADGMGIVLQQWTPMRNAKDNPVKVVIFVPDAQAMADKVTAAGGTIVTPAARTPVYDNRLLVVAKDLDGYLLEIVE